jgi:hypothetical protein
LGIFAAILIALLLAFAAGGVKAAGGTGHNVLDPAIPAWTSPASMHFFSPANASNKTTANAPIILTSTIFAPQSPQLSWQGGAGYFHPILAKWDQFSFYLPMPSYWEFFGGQKMAGAAQNTSLKTAGSPPFADYSTTSIRQFATSDGYYAGIEEHDDPDRMEL